MKSVDVIILKYLAPTYERACISRVLEHTEIPYHLTVHDNYPLNENIGSLWNHLIRKSEAEYICLLNSDAYVEDKWLEKLLQVFDDYQKVGAVSSVTNHAGGNGQEIPRTEDYKVINYSEKYPMGTLCGFCLVFPKKVWEEAGGFPEDFGFYGQECAFLAKVTKLGYSQLVRTDVFIWHKGSATAELCEQRGEMNRDEELKQGRLKRNAYFEKLRKS